MTTDLVSHDDVNAKVATRLQALRVSKEMTLEDVAKVLNVTRQAVGQLESGRRAISLPRAMQLAQVYEVTLDQLVGIRPVTEGQPVPFAGIIAGNGAA